MDKISDTAMRNGYDLSPIPDTLNAEWQGDGMFVFDTVYDGSSLVWIKVLQETFNELLPEYEWTVDDPGVLYAEGNGIEELEYDTPADEFPISEQALADASAASLDRYRKVYEELVAQGVPVS